MTGKIKISMEILEKESPFFIPELLEKYGWNYKTVWGYIHSYKRFHLFETEERENTHTKGRPGFTYTVKTNEN